MNPEFFAVANEQIVGLEQFYELPDEFLRSIPRQLDVVLETPTLAIGGWENVADGPLVLGLANTGQIVSLVAVNPAQLPTLGDTLCSIDYWLSSMTLPNLSELSGNSVDFYEGLLELSPGASVVLSPRRRYLLVTAVAELDLTELESRLPDADIEVRYLDVLRAPDGPAILRHRSHTDGNGQRTGEKRLDTVPIDSSAEAPPIARSAGFPPPVVDISNRAQSILDADLPDASNAEASEFVETETPTLEEAPEQSDAAETLETAGWPALEVDEVVPVIETDDANNDAVIDLTEPSAEIDLTEPSVEIDIADEAPSANGMSNTASGASVDGSNDPPPPVGAPLLPPIGPGRTYDLDALPLLFDATGTSLQSISKELFAVNNAIVIVTELPERRRDSPFEDRRRFRWDTTLERIQLLNEHGYGLDGNLRDVHLFVESVRQPGYAVYVGELSRTAFQTQTHIAGETAWFAIEPALDSDLYRTLRRGRLPQHRIDITAF